MGWTNKQTKHAILRSCQVPVTWKKREVERARKEGTRQRGQPLRKPHSGHRAAVLRALLEARVPAARRTRAAGGFVGCADALQVWLQPGLPRRLLPPIRQPSRDKPLPMRLLPQDLCIRGCLCPAPPFPRVTHSLQVFTQKSPSR